MPKSRDFITPAIIKKVADALRIRHEKLQEFKTSATFKEMLSSFSGRFAIQTDSENMAYFPETERKKLKWEAFTDEQINLFFEAITAAPDSPEIEAGTLLDTSEMFDSYQYKIHGVWVSIAHGQGTFIAVTNDAGHKEWVAQ